MPPLIISLGGLGLLTNLLCILVFTRLGLQKPINFLFTSLAAVDGLGLGCRFVQFIIEQIVIGSCLTESIYTMLIILIHLSEILLKLTNPMLTLFIAVIRYIMLADIAKFKLMVTLKRIKHLVLGILLISSAVYLMIMIAVKTSAIESENDSQSSNCYNFYFEGTAIATEYVVFCYLFVTLILSFLLSIVSVFIFRLLYKARQHTTNTLVASRCQEKTKMALYVLSGILLFSVLTTILILILVLSELRLIEIFSSTTTITVYFLSCALLYINNIVNLFIYMISKEFRENLKAVLLPTTLIQIHKAPENLPEIEMQTGL